MVKWGYSEVNRDFTAHAGCAPAGARQAAGQGPVFDAMPSSGPGRVSPISIAGKQAPPGMREPIVQPGEGIAKNGIMAVS
ncbi:MAG: hypothetical protein VB137_04340 [Burkholderia sp.]